MRLLEELVGCQILSPDWDRKLTEEDVNDLTNQIGEILSETFKAALGNPVHFQVTNSNDHIWFAAAKTIQTSASSECLRAFWR